MTDAPLQDPWETPIMPLDPEMVETSQRLMAEIPEVELATPAETVNETEILLQELSQEKTRLLERNAQLVAEVAQLRAVNRRLIEQAQPPQRAPGWFSRLSLFWRRSQPLDH